MKEFYDIPMVGSVFTREWSDPLIEAHSPRLRVEGASMRQRFAVQLCDDGLESLDIHDGDYLVFAQAGWPTVEESVCFVQQGDEAIVRIMQGVYDSEPMLVVTGDRYADIVLHRNQFIVNGQLVGVIRHKEVNWVQETAGEEFWGC